MSNDKKYYFLKLKEDFFFSGEVLIIEKMPNGMLYSNILLKLYLLSLKFNGFLKLNENVNYTPEMLASLTGHKLETVEKALDLFLELGLIVECADNSIYMSNIEDMVGTSSSEADRKRRARAELKRLGSQAEDKCPKDVRTLSEKCPTEIEKEIEIDKESELKQELYGRYKNVSLAHSDYEQLKNDYPIYADKYIDKLSEYMESTGKSYKNHLATIQKWLDEDIKTTNYTCKESESL